MFKKQRTPQKVDSRLEEPEEVDTAEDEGKKAKPIRLPFTIDLEYPIMNGKISSVTCESRPTMRFMKMMAAAADDEAEIINIMFNELFDLSPKLSDAIDMEDGMNILAQVNKLFPGLAGEEGK